MGSHTTILVTQEGSFVASYPPGVEIDSPMWDAIFQNNYVEFWWHAERRRLEFCPPCGPNPIWESQLNSDHPVTELISRERWANFEAWWRRSYY